MNVSYWTSQGSPYLKSAFSFAWCLMNTAQFPNPDLNNPVFFLPFISVYVSVYNVNHCHSSATAFIAKPVNFNLLPLSPNPL